MATSKLAFIGLGVMGYPIAGHLAKAGHYVTVYNRTTAKAKAWAKEFSGDFAETPAKAAEGCEIVFACVGNDDDLRSVSFGDDGILAGMDEGAIFVDHTTASADVAREIYAAAKGMNKRFLDGPVSGGQAGAENGALTVMVGGEQDAFDASKTIMQTYGKAVTLMGETGAGQLTKMVNQICIAGLVQGLSEGLNFADKAGLDAKLVVDVISKGAAQSWQIENRGYTMIDDKFNFGFAVDWMRKDLGICIAESKNNGAKLPVTKTVADFYEQIAKKGGNRWDTSSLIRLLKD
jgi:3-hydroxyisobutyrate dehydrogenase